MGTFADVTKVDPQVPTVEKTNLGDVMEGTRWASDSVNWFYRNFLSHHGEDLYDMLIKPIAGDFNRIKANGTAWEHAGDMAWGISENFSANSLKLASDHWSEGDASDAFKNHVNRVWTPAFYITKYTCGWMKKGFEKLADVSVKIATKCADLLNKILIRIGKLALKVVKYFGAGGLAMDMAAGAWEWMKNGFKWKDIPFPFWDDVKDINWIIDHVMKLHQAIKDIVDSIQAYFKGFKEVVETLGKIPDIDSTHKGIDVVDGFKSASDDMKDARKKFDKSQKAYEDEVDALDKKANDSVAGAG